MKNYQPQTPRAVFAIAALVMSVATMGALVGAPAALGGTETEVAISPATIDVVATRAHNVALADASSPHVDGRR